MLCLKGLLCRDDCFMVRLFARKLWVLFSLLSSKQSVHYDIGWSRRYYEVCKMLQLICLHKSECRQWMISSRLCRQMSLVSPGRYNSPRQQQQQCKHCHIPLTVHHYCSPRLIYSWWSVVRQLHLLWLNINCLHYFDEFSRCWHHHNPPATEAAVDLISPSRTSRSRGCCFDETSNSMAVWQPPHFSLQTTYYEIRNGTIIIFTNVIITTSLLNNDPSEHDDNLDCFKNKHCSVSTRECCMNAAWNCSSQGHINMTLTKTLHHYCCPVPIHMILYSEVTHRK